VPTEVRHDAVLVTGASRGLGLETALTLAGAGFDVWAGIRNMEGAPALEQTARNRGVQLNTIQLDVTRPDSIDRAIGVIVERSGGIFGLVNNAGVTARAYFEEFPQEAIEHIFGVNLFGTMNVTRRVLPFMRRAGRGRIVTMSSVGGRIGSMSVVPYCASKFALEGFSEALSLEMKPFGVQVVIIEPGIVETEIWDEHRRILPTAREVGSPYYELFWAAETEAKKLLKSSRLRPHDIAECVLRAMTSNKPRLRYVVGWRAGLVLSLRRHLPGELFEKFYFGELLRRVTKRSAERQASHRPSLDG
jgi:NAD(P)-dependent dehydrogenase (short-subunit alcohol dehydrogenase family)